MLVLKIIITILLPPLGVALEVGISTHFWINLILTLLGYLPGLIHGLWIILSKPRHNEAATSTGKKDFEI
jgi:uncharacterized membrane protein YqaE (UPF0057 family)